MLKLTVENFDSGQFRNPVFVFVNDVTEVTDNKWIVFILQFCNKLTCEYQKISKTACFRPSCRVNKTFM